MSDFLLELWHHVPTDIRPAVVSVLGTGATAVVGLIVVGIQLRGARKSNRQLEALKLKKEVYEEVLPDIKAAQQAHRALRSCVASFLNGVQETPVYRSVRPAYTPSVRVEDWVKLNSEFMESLIPLHNIVDRWVAIDLRLRVFQVAILALRKDMGAVGGVYANAVASYMPEEKSEGEVKQWNVPEGAELEKLLEVSQDYLNVLAGCSDIIADFLRELQNLLLREMFAVKVPPRKAEMDERYRAVTLDGYMDLINYYSDKKRWGNMAMSFYRKQAHRS